MSASSILPDPSCVRVAAVSDLHFHAGLRGLFAPRWTQLADKADLFLLCGDLTAKGDVAEARQLASELGSVPVPVVAVLGNHDFEQGAEVEISALLREHGVAVLDGRATHFRIREVQVGIAGTKGFCGGFHGARVQGEGEALIRQFVAEGAREARKLTAAAAATEGDVRLAITHYSPIEATLAGEPRELYPFLGDSRLEEAIDGSHVDMALHGHAHRGAPSGETCAGIPVHNVAWPVHHQPFRLFVLRAKSNVKHHPGGEP